MLKKTIGILAFIFIGLQAFAYPQKTSAPVKIQFLGIKSIFELNDAFSNQTPFKEIKGVKKADFPAKAKSKSLSSPFDPYNIGLNFKAVDASTQLGYSDIPLNINGPVGSTQYIVMTYQSMRSFNKITGQPDGVLKTSADSFFGVNASAQDVRMEYDRFAHRWYASCEINSHDIILAISSEDPLRPNTPWSFFKLSFSEICPQCCPDCVYPPPLPSPYDITDYQQLAIDQNAVYICVDVPGHGDTLIIIEKKSLLKGHPLVSYISGIDPSPTYEYTAPADNFDPDPSYIYLIHAPSSPLGFATAYANNTLLLYRVVNPLTRHPKLVGPIYIKVPTYSWPQNVEHKGNLAGEIGFLQAEGFIVAPHIRDKQLYLCHVSQLDASGNGTPDGDRTGIIWYQFDLTGDPMGRGCGKECPTTVPVLIQRGILFDQDAVTTTPLFYNLPGIMTNKYHDLFIGTTVSGQNAFTNISIAGRKRSDPPGTLRDPVLVTNNTSHAYNYTPLYQYSLGGLGQRWGDESCMAIDPNDEDVWYSGEFAGMDNFFNVQATQIKPFD